jgi:hypothetical protein
MNNAEIQRRIDGIQCYHEFDFGHGLRAEATTSDTSSHRGLWKFIEAVGDGALGITSMDPSCVFLQSRSNMWHRESLTRCRRARPQQMLILPDQDGIIRRCFR